MKQIDVRFSEDDMATIKNMLGKRMDKYKCDPFINSTTVYAIVGISLENSAYAFTNMTEVMDYYGEKEDVALFKIRRVSYDGIQSLVQNQEMIETPVERLISEIMVVNETQRLYEKNILIYEVRLTRGIIFKFDDGNELSFEKNIWFSENITVEKGYDLIRKFTSVKEFAEGWSEDYHGECSREKINFKL